MGIIRALGFVQLDSIQVVARAHHHILWSRNQNYREPMLDGVLGHPDGVFEHFTHDASILPMAFLPVWRRQFRRKQAQIDGASWFRTMPDAAGRATIRARIAAEGPLSTHAFDTKIAGPKAMWSRPPHKLALDYMWYGGELATSHRVNFTKFYDLAERVFPEDLHAQTMADAEQVDRLCHTALDRLVFANPAEIKAFWDATDRAEVAAWIAGAGERLRPVEVETAQGEWVPALAPALGLLRLSDSGRASLCRADRGEGGSQGGHAAGAELLAGAGRCMARETACETGGGAGSPRPIRRGCPGLSFTRQSSRKSAVPRVRADAASS